MSGLRWRRGAPIPELDSEGLLPAELHGASLHETIERFGLQSDVRSLKCGLLEQVVAAAIEYSLIKRVLVWGSFVTAKPEPGDLDYSIVVESTFDPGAIAAQHKRFLDPLTARIYYRLDRGHLVLQDYPFEEFADRLRFLGHTRAGEPCGIIEISLRCEAGG